MLYEYIILFVYLLLALAIAILVVALSFFLVYQNSDLEKTSSYECGFNPFGDSRGRFEVRFYLVAILFIIFDLEVSFLFPWSVVVSVSGLMCYVMCISFLLILLLGFLYEWVKGALD